MDEITALHTVVRRFCQEEFALWAGRYAALQNAGQAEIPRSGSLGWDYSDDGYEIFPRYRLVEVIQDEVEKNSSGRNRDYRKISTRSSLRFLAVLVNQIRT
jgi:hypothetical protein